MNYKCYSCANKVRKADFGGKLKDFALTGAKSFLSKIPLFGDNLQQLTGLDDYQAKGKMLNKFQKVDEKIDSIINPIKDTIATTGLDSFAPGAGQAASALNGIVDSAQNKKNSGMPLASINPRYAQTGGKVKKVKGGNLKQISSTALEAEGKSHADGGIKLTDDVEIEGGEGVHTLKNKDVVVSSDSLQDPHTGYTFAEQMKELERKKGKLEMSLEQENQKTDNKVNNNIILYKKKIDELSKQIELLYGKQELIAMQNGLRDKKGNPNQLSQDIVPGPQKQMYGGSIYKSGGWIGKVNKSIAERGTTGRCTGSNFGGQDCPPGSRQYNLAVTFKNMAKNRKHEHGGKVYDQNGYLISNKHNFTSKKIISGNGGYTPITTNKMAFPINANGIPLFPGTGDYIFPGNKVIETPLKGQYGMPSLVKPQTSNLVSGAMNTNPTGSINSIMKPTPFQLGNVPVGSNVNNNTTPSGNAAVSGNTNTSSINPIQAKTVEAGLPTTSLPATNVTGNVSNDGIGKKFDWKNAGLKAGEIGTAVSPALTEGIFQKIAGKPEKYSTSERHGDGLSELKNNITNALPNAAKQQQDNQNAALSSTMRALTDAGEKASTMVPGVVGKVIEQGNTLFAQTMSNMNQQLVQYNDITRKIEDAKAQEDYQTAKQLEQDKNLRLNNMKMAIGKSIENMNNYAATYGPDGQKAADDMVLKLINKLPYFQQNEELMNMLQKTNPEVYARLKTQQSATTTSPPPIDNTTGETSDKRKYGGLISRYGSDIKIKR